MTTTEEVQFILVGFQMVVLLVFAVMAFAKWGSSETGVAFRWDWFNPSGLTLSAFIAGLSGSIFAFWGWEPASRSTRSRRIRTRLRAEVCC